MIRAQIKWIVLTILILVILVNGCQKIPESKLEIKKESAKTLSELQISACNTANEAGTCDTRLAELGIVLKEDCCKSLGKCC